MKAYLYLTFLVFECSSSLLSPCPALPQRPAPPCVFLFLLIQLFLLAEMTECQHRGRPPGLPFLLLVLLLPQVLSSEEDTFPDTSSPSLLLPHIQLEDDWQRYLLPPYAPPKVWKRFFIDITHFSRTEIPAWSC